MIITLKILKISLFLFGISFILSILSIIWTWIDPALHIFYEFNAICLAAALYSLISFIIGIAWGFLIIHWLNKNKKI